jgi:hypothetical protein
MTIHHCREALEERLTAQRLIPPEGSILRSCASDTAGMVSAYYHDGLEFLSRGDRANALASFSYALGWIDAGICFGLLSSTSCGIPLCAAPEQRSSDDSGTLREKTSRYHSFLSRALVSLDPAPEPDTCLFAGGARIILIGEVFLAWGAGLEAGGDDERALAAYSYGFGWLDAGVRAGLFRVRLNRELFTI